MVGWAWLVVRPDLVIRLGILGLPLAGLALAASTWSRGAWLEPGDAGFEAWVATPAFGAWASASLNATVWLAFGLLALAAALARRAPRGPLAWGTFLGVLGLMVHLVPAGMYRIVWPEGPEAAAAVAANGTYLVWLWFARVTAVAGGALLGWCVLRAGWPGWLGVALAVGIGLMFVRAWHWLEVAGSLVLAVACVGLAWHAWRPRWPAGRQRPAADSRRLG